MQVDTNNYNTLGRIGPHYPQPEYRPKGNSETGKTSQEGSSNRGKQPDLVAKERLLTISSEGRLNLQAVKALTAQTASAISQLPPEGRNQGPHIIGKDVGLLAPRYI
jgi:hypothetical protein